MNPTVQNGIMTTATLLYELEQGDIIDMDLKNLIGFWMAVEPDMLVNLQHTLPLVEQAVATRNEAFYAGVPRETDASVRAFLQIMLYDADDTPPPWIQAVEAIPPVPLPLIFPPPDGFGDGPDGPDGPDDDDGDDFGFGPGPMDFHAPPDFQDPGEIGRAHV